MFLSYFLSLKCHCRFIHGIVTVAQMDSFWTSILGQEPHTLEALHADEICRIRGKDPSKYVEFLSFLQFSKEMRNDVFLSFY